MSYYLWCKVMIVSDSVYQFQAAISDAGLGSPEIITDGCLYRFRVDGDCSGSKNGWYLYHLGAICGGAFGSWKTGISETWRENGKCLSQYEWRKMKAKIVEDNRQRKAELNQQQLAAADNAQSVWNQSAESLFLPYLKTKRVLPFGIRQRDNLSVIPLMDVDGKIWSYQTISSTGEKRFMKGGRITGNFYLIGDIKYEVYICEGFATGATLRQLLNKPVVVAFNAGNLKAVAISIKKKYPKISITIAADNDVKTDGNPGLTKGREAAAAVGGKVIYPSFSDENFTGTDFNDYFNGGGVL